MRAFEVYKLQSKLTHNIKFHAWTNPYAVTLTFKESVRDLPPMRLPDDLRAQKNVRHFQNLLNRAILPRWVNRKGLRLASAFVFEFGGDSTAGLHCHGMIECPNPDHVETLPRLVAELWKGRTYYGDHQLKVVPCNVGWVDYMLKVETKPDYAQCVANELWQLPGDGKHYRA